jgi:hypothetical protein
MRSTSSKSHASLLHGQRMRRTAAPATPAVILAWTGSVNDHDLPVPSGPEKGDVLGA